MPAGHGQFLAGLDLPDAGRAIVAGGRHPPGIGDDRQAVDRAGLGAQPADQAPGANIPDQQLASKSAAEDPAVTGEGDAVHLAGDILKGADRLGRLGVPQLEFSVEPLKPHRGPIISRSGDQTRSIGRPRHRQDAQRVVVRLTSPIHFRDERSRRSIPDAHLAIEAARGESLAVGRECKAEDKIFMSGGNFERGGGQQLDDPHLFAAGQRQKLPIGTGRQTPHAVEVDSKIGIEWTRIVLFGEVPAMDLGGLGVGGDAMQRQQLSGRPQGDDVADHRKSARQDPLFGMSQAL